MIKLGLRSFFGYAGLGAVVFGSGVVGCQAETSEPSDMQQRQDAALRDPFSYGPDMPGGTKPMPTPAATPRDDSFKGEWERFWNP